MNSKIRRRAMRGFLASLLQSDLSEADILDLSYDLINGSFGGELGEFVRGAMLNLSTSVGSKSEPHSAEYPTPHTVYNIIARRKLSKKAVQEMMTVASPWIRSSPNLPNGTMRELVDRYFAIASPPETARFLNVLQGESTDPYLKGISRRS